MRIYVGLGFERIKLLGMVKKNTEIGRTPSLISSLKLAALAPHQHPALWLPQPVPCFVFVPSYLEETAPSVSDDFPNVVIVGYFSCPIILLVDH